jgi:hypothetical protein
VGLGTSSGGGRGGRGPAHGGGADLDGPLAVVLVRQSRALVVGHLEQTQLQHILDPYTFSHVLHGVVFFGGLHLVMRGRWPRVQVVIAALLEAAWEVAENTERVIQHYRETTISLDYFGDSVGNSVADIGFCVLGFLIAAAVPGWVSAVGFALTELMLLAWIRDSLLLNVLMLVYPLEAVKRWQVGE